MELLEKVFRERAGDDKEIDARDLLYIIHTMYRLGKYSKLKLLPYPSRPKLFIMSYECTELTKSLLHLYHARSILCNINQSSVSSWWRYIAYTR